MCRVGVLQFLECTRSQKVCQCFFKTFEVWRLQSGRLFHNLMALYENDFFLNSEQHFGKDRRFSSVCLVVLVLISEIGLKYIFSRLGASPDSILYTISQMCFILLISNLSKPNSWCIYLLGVSYFARNMWRAALFCNFCRIHLFL